MNTKMNAIAMTLLMIASALAGCTSGDPDGDGTSGIDMEILNEMIDDNLQDFINNTSVTINQEIHYHNNTTYIVDDGDYSSTTNVEYNNTTINEGDQTNTNNFNNQTENDYSALNYSFGGVSGGNGSGGGTLYLLDIQFTLEDLMPDWEEIDHRNNTIDYAYTYYDYLTNEDRTDVFTINCIDYYLVGSQSNNTNEQVSYWQDSNNYWDAWVDQYNQTIANMLEQAAQAYYPSNGGVDDYHVRVACDENYNPGGGFDDLLLFEIPLPVGVAISGIYHNDFRAMEEYVWGYENYNYDYLSSSEGYSYTGYGDMKWRNDYYPTNSWGTSSAFSVQFEFETISWSYHSGGWVGGDEASILNVNVNNIYPGYEYRLIAYFTMSPAVPLE